MAVATPIAAVESAILRVSCHVVTLLAISWPVITNEVPAMKQSLDMARNSVGPNPSGLCQCGCGQMTEVSDYTKRSRGMVKGAYRRYRFGHSISKARTNLPRGAAHPNWKGGGYVNTGGWMMLGTHGDRRLEHRLVFDLALGRRLVTSEVVHHINGKKTDNRIENLMYFKSTSAHSLYEWKYGWYEEAVCHVSW